jgi:hypothetical protein
MKKLCCDDIYLIGKQLEREYSQCLSWTFGMCGLDYLDEDAEKNNENLARVINEYLALTEG